MLGPLIFSEPKVMGDVIRRSPIMIEIRATSNLIGIETQQRRPADRATSQAKQATGQFLSLSQLYQPLR